MVDSIGALLAERAGRLASAPCLIDAATASVRTYREVHERAWRWAAGFLRGSWRGFRIAAKTRSAMRRSLACTKSCAAPVSLNISSRFVLILLRVRSIRCLIPCGNAIARLRLFCITRPMRQQWKARWCRQVVWQSWIKNPSRRQGRYASRIRWGV